MSKIRASICRLNKKELITLLCFCVIEYNIKKAIDVWRAIQSFFCNSHRYLNKNIVVNHKLHSNIISDKSNKFETFQEQQQAKEGKPCF